MLLALAALLSEERCTLQRRILELVSTLPMESHDASGRLPDDSINGAGGWQCAKSGRDWSSRFGAAGQR
jgi:hypothetical protein